MTKICKDYATIRGKMISVEIHYNQKQKFFYRGIPDEIYQMTSLGSRTYASEDELKRALICALATYHEKIKQQRKMIVYKLKGSDELVRKPQGEFGWGGIKPGVSDKFQTCTGARYLFGFDFDIVMEVTGSGIQYFTLDQDDKIKRQMHIDSYSGYILIEWTSEREQFFRNLAEQLQRLVMGASAFFDRSDMLKLMDKGEIKMLGQ